MPQFTPRINDKLLLRGLRCLAFLTLFFCVGSARGVREGTARLAAAEASFVDGVTHEDKNAFTAEALGVRRRLEESWLDYLKVGVDVFKSTTDVAKEVYVHESEKEKGNAAQKNANETHEGKMKEVHCGAKKAFLDKCMEKDSPKTCVELVDGLYQC